MWSQDLKSLASRVSQAVTHYGADKVGVYLVAFDEVAPIFIVAHRSTGMLSYTFTLCIFKEITYI